MLGGGFLLESLLVRLTGDSTQYQRMLREAQHATQTATQHIAHLGRQMTSAFTLPVSLIAAASGKMFAGFETQLAQIEGLAGKSKQQVQEWSDDILKLAAAVGKSPDELARGMYFIASSGVEASKGLDILTQSAKASAAGLGDTQVIADAITSGMNAYTKEGMSATRMLDVMTAAVREGKGEASHLASAIGNLLPMASAMGVSFEDVAGVTAIMTRTGTTTSQAIVSIQGVLSSLTKPADKAVEILDKFGLNAKGLQEEIKKPGGLVNVMRKLQDAFEGDTDAMAGVFRNVRPLRAAMSILAQDGKTVDGVLQAMRDSSGDMEKAFQVVAQTVTFKFRQALATLQVALIRVGVSVAEVVTPVIQKLGEWINRATMWWQSLDKSTRRVIIGVALLVAAMGPMLIIVSMIGPALGMLGGMFLKFLHPIEAVVHGLMRFINPLVLLPLLALPIIGILKVVGISLLMLVHPLRLLSVAWMLMFGPTAILIFTLLKIVPLTVLFINKSGGLEKAWLKIQEAIAAVLKWLEPIGQAFYSLFRTVVEYGWNAIVMLGEHTKHMFDDMLKMLGVAEVNWQEVADTIRYGVVTALRLAELMVRNVHEVALVAWNGVTAALQPVIDETIRLALVTYQWTMDFIRENQQVFLSIVGIAVGLGIAVLAFKALIVVVVTMHAALVALKLKQIATAIAWATWTAAIVLAKVAVATWTGIVALATGAVWLWNAGLGAFVAMLAIGNIAMAAWAAGVLVAKVVTWLWNAALTVMNVLLSPVTILAFLAAVWVLVAALGVLIVATVAVTAGVAAIGAGAGALITTLMQLPTTFGPIAHIGGLLGEWYEIILAIIDAVNTDMTMAWEIMKAGFFLAVNQIRDLWPPLWQFIRTSFAALWDVVGATMELAFYQAFANVLGQLLMFVDIFGIATKKVETALNDINKAAAEARQGALNVASKQLQKAAQDFKVVDSEATQDARVMVNAWLDALDFKKSLGDQTEDAAAAAMETLKKELEDGGKTSTNKFNKELEKGIASGVDKFDAVLVGSAEALSRIRDFTERTREAKDKANQAGKASKPALAELAGKDAEIKQLKDTLITLRETERRAIAALSVPDVPADVKKGLQTNLKEVAGQIKKGEEQLKKLEGERGAAGGAKASPIAPLDLDQEIKRTRDALKTVSALRDTILGESKDPEAPADIKAKLELDVTAAETAIKGLEVHLKNLEVFKFLEANKAAAGPMKAARDAGVEPELAKQETEIKKVRDALEEVRQRAQESKDALKGMKIPTALKTTLETNVKDSEAQAKQLEDQLKKLEATKAARASAGAAAEAVKAVEPEMKEVEHKVKETGPKLKTAEQFEGLKGKTRFFDEARELIKQQEQFAGAEGNALFFEEARQQAEQHTVKQPPPEGAAFFEEARRLFEADAARAVAEAERVRQQVAGGGGLAADLARAAAAAETVPLVPFNPQQVFEAEVAGRDAVAKELGVDPNVIKSDAEILKEIRDELKKQNKKATVVFEPAGL